MGLLGLLVREPKAGVNHSLVRTDLEAATFGLEEGISLFFFPCLSPAVYLYPEP